MADGFPRWDHTAHLMRLKTVSRAVDFHRHCFQKKNTFMFAAISFFVESEKFGKVKNGDSFSFGRMKKE